MTKTETAWAELQDAMAIVDPSCRNDPRFTAETKEHDADLLAICAGCPLVDPCSTYARTANITQLFGYYGGVVRRGSHRHLQRRS
jgi:hypothetical protein